MKNLLTLIRLEAQTRTPFPILEFIQLLCFSSIYFQIFLGASFSSGSIDMFRISIMSDVLLIWSHGLKVSFLVMGIILAVFISMTFAGEYESGLMMSKLTLPIARSEYLSSKLLLYIFFTFISLSVSYILVLFLSPLQISLFRFTQIIYLTISQLILLVSIPLFFAIFSRKNSVSILLTLTIEIVIFLIFHNIPVPFGYFLNPSSILTSNNHLEGLIWGVMLPFLTGGFLLSLTFVKFCEMDITHGDV